ncbi:Epoxyqueuosine reductase [Pirellulimonas nuda]|uniref:Epoxyqueuosine reductase n=1 Tax=Pirellulimonas nuda TaxID=2528009 RepID=A0A518DB57_9BACT|nr:tRNA epoxyqueuosine(34) reductase QueG [Pirellulimonas nuda]QDU88682.1 Epoxyqueuosine reductase [Pirellulimonas nuda]
MTATVPRTQWLKNRAIELGFTQAGVCPAVEPPGAQRLREWLAAGYAGQMDYLADRRDAYAHPQHVLEGCRSLLMLAMDYRTADPRPPGPTQGRVSRYAWGEADYHDVVRTRLHRLADELREREPTSLVRGVVDTAPLMERDFARLAGLGWVGKHTLLLNRQRGSYFFLAALLTDLELEYDTPHATDHCGSCTACLDACPTGAFPQAYVLDATKCISYLTIELRDHVPVELRSGMGQWVFGCDVCQDVCPWNRRAPESQQPEFRPVAQQDPLELIGLFELDEEAFRARFRKTPLWRAHRRGLLRSAAIALGNSRPPEALPALQQAMHDGEALVREAARWAVQQYELHQNGHRGASDH